MKKSERKNYPCSNLIINDSLKMGNCTLVHEKEFLIPESKDGMGKPQITSQSWDILPEKSLPISIVMEKDFVDIECVNSDTGAKYTGKAIVRNVNHIQGTGPLNGF